MLIQREITETILNAAIEVHKQLGPGLLESAYEACLCYELSQKNLGFETQVSLPVEYKEVKLDCGYRIDIVVEKCVLLELKAVEELLPIHEAQLMTYLRLSKIKVGFLINFNVPKLMQGVKRRVL
jgi:GxxExxY protein